MLHILITTNVSEHFKGEKYFVQNLWSAYCYKFARNFTKKNMATDMPGERNMVSWDNKQQDMSQRNKKYLLEVLLDTHMSYK